MKFAICNEVYQDWNIANAFADAKLAGYTGIELAPFTLAPNPREITAISRRNIRDLARDNGLSIVGLHWLLAQTQGFHLTHPDREIRARTARYLIDLTRLCADLGGRIMVFGSPQQRNLSDGCNYEQAVRNAREVLAELSPALEDNGVTLALEPLGKDEGDFLLTAESAIDLARAVDSPKVRLHLDVKAMSTESKPIPEIIRDSRDWLVHFHANDPNRRGPGMGEVDFRPILGALRDINYDGWVSVEVFDYSPGIEALTRQSIRNLQQIEQSMSQFSQRPSKPPVNE